jgi:nicotinamidase-related amidase
MPKIVDSSGTALVIVDIQNDFLPPDGSLAVPKGRDILSLVYALLSDARWKDLWTHVVVSMVSALEVGMALK